MKRFFTTLSMLLLFSSLTIVNAVNIEGDISITDYVFDGKGKITSFDIDSEGNVLICVNQAYSHNRYIMIFHPDRTLIRTFEFQVDYTVYARFTEEGNIVLYSTHSNEATVFNCYGEVLYEYSENINQEIAELEREINQSCGDAFYEINLGRTQIKKYPEENVEVFYEIKSAAPEFMVFWCFSMLFILGSMMALLIHREKAIKRYKEGLERNRETT